MERRPLQPERSMVNRHTVEASAHAIQQLLSGDHDSRRGGVGGSSPVSRAMRERALRRAFVRRSGAGPHYVLAPAVERRHARTGKLQRPDRSATASLSSEKGFCTVLSPSACSRADGASGSPTPFISTTSTPTRRAQSLQGFVGAELRHRQTMFGASALSPPARRPEWSLPTPVRQAPGRQARWGPARQAPMAAPRRTPAPHAQPPAQER